VSRRDDTRPAVRATIETLTRTIGPLGLDRDGVWLPAYDPFRVSRSAGPDRSDARTTA